MPKTKAPYKITKVGKTITISDQITINRRELILFPIPLFAFLSLILIFLFGATIITSLTLSILFSLLFEVLYILFRFSAWIFYKEIEFNFEKSILKIINKRLNHILSEKIVTDRFDINKVKFKEDTRGGQKKYILTYSSHNEIILLVINSELSKNEIETYLKRC